MEEGEFSDAAADDLEGIEVAEPGEEAAGDSGNAGTGEADPELAGVAVPEDAMGFEEWYREAWIGGHEAVNIVLRTQSLDAAPKAPHGRRAALGVYRTCCRVPMLNFVLRPGPEWARDLAAVAVYAYFTGAGVASELMERKAQAAAAAASSETAGQDPNAGNGEASDRYSFAAKADEGSGP